MNAFGAYVSVLRDEFAWSSTALAAAFSIQRIQTGVLGPVYGWLVDRFGPRSMIRIGLFLFGISFMLFSQINSLVTFYAVFMLMALGAGLGGMLATTTAVVNWFERRRSTAMGIIQAGMSAGGLAVPLVAWSMAVNGWRETAFASGVLILVVGLPLSQLMRTSPEEYGYLPDGEQPDGDEVSGHGDRVRQDSPGFTAREALRTRAFWFLGLGHASATVVVSAILVHMIEHLSNGLGYTIATASIFVGLMTAIALVGQLAGGFLGDRFNNRKMATLAMFGHALGLVVLAYATNLAMVLFFTIVHGIAWGMRAPLMQAMRADYFGRKSFAKIMGFSTTIVMTGMTAGPLLAGYMADRYGNYQLGFTVLAAVAAIGSVFFFFAYKPTPPGERATTRQQVAGPAASGIVSDD